MNKAGVNSVEASEAKPLTSEEEKPLDPKGSSKEMPEAEAVEEVVPDATAAPDAGGAAKGLNDNAHGIDRFGYRVRCLFSPCLPAATPSSPSDTEPVAD